MPESFIDIYEQKLAPYAMRSKDSKGRVNAEPSSRGDEIRGTFQRDRDRIVHSHAFRRLAYKTQVFVNSEGDYYRSRLTHTLEVAQVGRTIARALGLNEDLTEAVILAHDLGHAPYGHAGQDVLATLMKDHGGFEHNRQSLRIVDVLERRYVNYRGLNLSFETRSCILKHQHTEIRKKLGFALNSRPLLEGQVADLADSIAYDQHDVDDALKAGLIHWDDLKDLKLWRRAMEHCKKRVKDAGPKADSDRRVLRREAVRYLLGLQVADVIDATKDRLQEMNIDSPEAARGQAKNIVQLSDELAPEKSEFQRFLHARVYRHYRLQRMQGKARRIL
ncbi:MAG: deoxyguanosinetriphosphate triphosphohydrolase, partial [Planctomycetota bacterium]|nr:deoxyguanosinetriphosphate triphosphohydrolase [Planctomycetota bacterium]